MTDMIRTIQPQYAADDIKMAASSFYAKLIAAHSYNVTGKLDCDVLLVKAETTGAAKTDYTYRMAEICSNQEKLAVHTVSGDHRSFIQAENSARVMEIIKQWL